MGIIAHEIKNVGTARRQTRDNEFMVIINETPSVPYLAGSGAISRHRGGKALWTSSTVAFKIMRT